MKLHRNAALSLKKRESPATEPLGPGDCLGREPERRGAVHSSWRPSAVALRNPVGGQQVGVCQRRRQLEAGVVAQLHEQRDVVCERKVRRSGREDRLQSFLDRLLRVEADDRVRNGGDVKERLGRSEIIPREVDQDAQRLRIENWMASLRAKAGLKPDWTPPGENKEEAANTGG